MKIVYVLGVVMILCSCGSKETKVKDNPDRQKDTNQVVAAANKDYLKKRPEEFQEFFMLTDVVAFTGKVATKKDVEHKRAVFNMDSKKDATHHALNIRLPFFAFLIKPNKQPSEFVAVMQAETLKGDTILGYKAANGLFGICKPRQLEYFESQKNQVYSAPE
jgi:hypothetical protein